MGAENNKGFDWEEFRSVIRYYYNYTDEEYYSHSYPFMFAMYAKYPNRACENLGVSSEKKEQKTEEVEEKYDILLDEDYPEELRALNEL